MNSQRNLRNQKIARLDKFRASLLALCWSLLLGGGVSMISQGSINRNLVVLLGTLALACLAGAQLIWLKQAQMLSAARQSNSLKAASQTSFS